MSHMSGMKCIRHLLILTVLVICGLLAAGCTSSAPAGSPGSATQSVAPTPAGAQETVLVFAGAGLKAPLDEIGAAFRQKYSIDVQYNYGGAGTLVSQMNLTHKGDVFIPGSTAEWKTAQSQGLVDSYQIVAYHVPAIAVQKGNPKQIETVKDLARPGLRVALGDVNATAIGKAGAKIFQKFNITASVEKNVVTRTPTINELVTLMNAGQADAAIMTLDSINTEKLDLIAIPLGDNQILMTPVGVTTYSKNTNAANKFAAYVASDEGKAFFAKHGFPTYPDPMFANVRP